ncbi:hypothetical protein [Nocardia jiangxiensis]|uniref:hypothetical protein n=1 Tax=Nocardia jiangxiensis TaxID=282685 RepID=UPI0003172879|nr:hypothetical protein [Nocardia jiangxiensis]
MTAAAMLDHHARRWMTDPLARTILTDHADCLMIPDLCACTRQAIDYLKRHGVAIPAVKG